MDQYLRECIDIYEKTVSQTKEHFNYLKKLEQQYLVIKETVVAAAIEVNAADGFTVEDRIINMSVVNEGAVMLAKLARERKWVMRSLVITVDSHLTLVSRRFRDFEYEIEMTINEKKKTAEKIKSQISRLTSICREFPFIESHFYMPEEAMKKN